MEWCLRERADKRALSAMLADKTDGDYLENWLNEASRSQCENSKLSMLAEESLTPTLQNARPETRCTSTSAESANAVERSQQAVSTLVNYDTVPIRTLRVKNTGKLPMNRPWV
jgi:hypothetical protein